MTGPGMQRIESAILLQGPLLAEVRWILRAGVREIWRVDNVTPSPAITTLLRELEVMIKTSRAGSGEVPQLDDPAQSITDERITTAEAAQMLGITTRQVRNLTDRLGGTKTGPVLSFDLAAVEAELSRRGDTA